MEHLHDAANTNIPASILVEEEYTTVEDIVSKERRKRLFNRGLVWLGIGISLMGLSFVMNILLFEVDKSFVTYMYVMTTAGTAMILKGMVDILGF